MNKNIVIVVLFITLTCQLSKLQAQSAATLLTDINAVTSDSLTIERADGQKIIMVWPYRKNIQKAVAWEELLEDFQSDFRKVYSDIPDYDYYHINYSQKKNLVINQIIGRQTFTVDEQESINYVKSNLCFLRGEKLRISIEFTDYGELLDPSLKQDINNAVAQVKNRFYISMVSPERHLFDVKNNKIFKPKRKYKFFVPLGVQLGMFRNKPYIEMRPGIGVIVDNKAYFALQYNLMTQFNDQSPKTEYDHYIGLTSGSIPHGFGSDVGIAVKNGITSHQNIALRAGLNFRTKGGLLMSAHYYLDASEERNNDGIDFGFSIGYGF